MKFIKSIHAVDSHTAGESTRVVVGGIPKIPGKSMPEKKEWLEKNLDYLRTAIMLEPRGHNDMFGSIMTQPTVDEADYGIILGHVQVENGKAKKVSFQNVPAFLYKKDQEVELPGHGKIKFDISFGGSFFAIVKADQVGLEIKPENAAVLQELGIQLRDIINKEIPVQHPTLSHIHSVDLVEWWSETETKDATLKNCVVFGQGQVDRSPCGTGTCAKMATLFAKGELKVGEKFYYESILGTIFEGEILGTTKVGDYDAVIPQITGSAYITGFNHFVIDEEDPVKYGFVWK